MSNEPRQYIYSVNGRDLGEIIHYLGLPPQTRWQAQSSINEHDGGHGFPTRYEAEEYLRAQAAMMEKPQ